MELVQNIPFFCIMISLFSGSISSVLPGKYARWLNAAMLSAVIAMSGWLLIWLMESQIGSYTYMMGHFPAPWGNELRVGVLEAGMALFFSIIMLLSLLGGLDVPTQGSVLFDGEDIAAKGLEHHRRNHISLIFQSYNLIPHQTILGNVELALTIAGISREERIARAKRALDRVGLAGQYNKRPNQLSGGQCQRVAIARALVNDPDILLADEPTGNLDSKTSVQIMGLFQELYEQGKTVIVVTHEEDIALHARRIIKLRDGKIESDTQNPHPAMEI